MEMVLGRLFRKFARLRGGINPLTFDLLFDSPAGSKRILILADAARATFHLYFEAPLKALYPNYSFALLTHDSLSKALDSCGSSAVEDWLLSKYEPAILITTRFAHPDGATIIRAARKKGIPTFYHLDDDLLDVPDTLGPELRRSQKDESVVTSRRAMMSESDALMASTATLAERLKKTFPDKSISIGPPAPYLPMGAIQTSQSDSSNFTIGYMGSRGHQRDLNLVLPAIAKLMSRYPDLCFETFGTLAMPDELQLAFPNRVKAWPAIGQYEHFQKFLKSLRWTLGIAPLIDDNFNRCKTPIKFLEYSAAGIPVFASDLNVYQLPGSEEAIRLIPAGEWEHALVSAIENRALLNGFVTNAQSFCETNFSLGATKSELTKTLERL